ncbi:HpcH/HpaI aldolase/citrate lyase family protein [Nocardia pseudovaccinii]|uniref:HpcH/HpaI aldolase/citrate lyase family protein n=1 Tax=Nocardia pseudovaccinii TaxID=189540 RepID=UPI0007A39E71|nr:CoA ester lyase [Nocardia pseudovaccinii]
MRLRRSELSTPGSSEKMLAKAAASDADLVFCDLEDSVAPAEKVSARQKIVHALINHSWRPATRAVRINDLETHYAYRDIIDVVTGARDAVDIVIVPKIKSARDVWWVDKLLTQLETDLGLTKRIGIEVLIEEVEAMIAVEEIAQSSPRLEALIFGPGDYSASQGVRVKDLGDSDGSYPGDLWHYARNKIAIAARAAKIDAIDGPFAAFGDPDGYRRQAKLAHTVGFSGKWAIHPSQITLANAEFAPSPQEVAEARKLVEAFDDAQARGLGAVAVDGTMVDIASVRILRVILDRATALGI